MIDIISYKNGLQASEEDIRKLLDDLQAKKEDDRSFFSLILEVDEKYLHNHKICLLILEALQLSKSEAIYSTYDLKDIEAVFDLMLKYYPNDLQLWMDAIYFNFNVLDNEEKVREMVSKLTYKISSVSRQIDDIRKEL